VRADHGYQLLRLRAGTCARMACGNQGRRPVDAVAGGGEVGCQAPTPTRPPNLPVILVDDLGYNDVSSCGAPDIDRCPPAAEGMRFTDLHASSPVCSPTRAALMTGRLPELVGVPGAIRQDPNHSRGNLADAAMLLADPLVKAGYHPAIVGKGHLGYEPPHYPLDCEIAFSTASSGT
jgi:arylsulfatase A-like enzyme